MNSADFTIPAFLRAIGRGPDEKPEWWYREQLLSGSDDGWSFNSKWHEGDYLLNEKSCPFADILTDWTPEKDALLLGVGLEYERANGNHNCGWFIFTDPKPGERLARAIWDAIGGGK